MSESEKAVRQAFLDKALLPNDYGTDVAQMERIADGLVAALKKYDEIALEVRRTGTPPRNERREGQGRLHVLLR